VSDILDFLRALFGGAGDAPVDPPEPPYPEPPDPTGLLVAINLARFRAGLKALLFDGRMCLLASSWAAYLAKYQTIDHGNFAGRISSVHPDTAAGEDIAEGYANASACVAGWLADPPHRAILLGDYDRAGVGRAVSSNGSIYWVADFDLLA
jgi:uncharacterized protein YkwD